MGSYSRNTFDALKHYVGVRMQQGKPIVDADWNEMDDIRKYELKDLIGSFIGNGVPDDDGFKIDATNPPGLDFTIHSGVCLAGGWIARNPSDIAYTEQGLFKGGQALAQQWGVDPLMDLGQLTANAEFTVYLDAWEREVTSQEDPNLVDNRIGIETCVRLKLEWVVRVQANPPGTPPPGHETYPLAVITLGRPGEVSVVRDLRLTDVLLTQVTSSTGVVVFPTDEHTAQGTSIPVEHGLGPGPIMIQLGVEKQDTHQITIGNPDVFSLPSLAALVDQGKGSFQIGIKAPGNTLPETSVRWWAVRPRIDKGLVNLQPGIFVAVLPSSKTLAQGATQRFTATVSGTMDQQVAWSIKEGPTGGTIDAQGNYTAPNTAGTFHVIATSHADNTKTGSVEVTVMDISIAIQPQTIQLAAGGTQRFTATVSGTINQQVSWQVREGAAGGTIDNQGNYTAPNAGGTFNVRVTSAASNAKFATAAVTVSDISVSIQPTTPKVVIGGTQQFTATVSGAVNTGVSWQVEEGTTGGIIDNQGRYTAPNTPGTFHVRATSVANNAKFDRATVAVAPHTLTVDPSAATLQVQGTQQFRLLVDGSPVTQGVAWAATTGTIDSAGFYRATTAGPVTVTATLQGQSATATVTVNHCTGTGADCTAQGQPAVSCSTPGLPGVPACSGQGNPNVPCTTQGQPGVACTTAGKPGEPCVGTGPDCTAVGRPDRTCTLANKPLLQ